MTTNHHHHNHQGEQHGDRHGDGDWRTPRVGSGARLRERVVRAPRVRGLRLGTDGRLTVITYRGRAHHALRAPLGVRAADAPGGVGLEALDDDLTMWFDEYGAEHQAINPAASVVAAAFGRHEQVYGPVVFSGWVETGAPFGGRTCDVSAAATVLLAGIAASTDLTTDPVITGTTTGTGVVDVPRQRAVEWSGLGVEITRGPGRESFDALAWTITRDDIPRCVECGEPGSHPEHQPEALEVEAGEAGGGR